MLVRQALLEFYGSKTRERQGNKEMIVGLCKHWRQQTYGLESLKGNNE